MEWMQTTWFWWAFALVLFAAEAILPGTFMLWLGLGAAATGLVTVLFPELGLAAQWIVFSILALISVLVGWRYKNRLTPRETDQPLLNRRAEQLIDRVFPLETAIVNGRGKVKIGDALWTVEGDDLPAGQRVRVIAVDGMTLRVRGV